jgi:hypothetical protein
MNALMNGWQTELTRRFLQMNVARSLALAIALHFLAVLIWRFSLTEPDAMPIFATTRSVPVQLQPYAEILRLEPGGGQGGGEGGGSLNAPLPKEIPGTSVPVPDAIAQTDTFPVTPAISPAIDSSNAGGTGLPGSSWGSGGTGWGTGSGDGVGLSKIIAMPRPLMISIPEYPQAARKAKIEGLVELNIKIDETGKVVNAIVMRNTTQNEDCRSPTEPLSAGANHCRSGYHLGPSPISVFPQ